MQVFEGTKAIFPFCYSMLHCPRHYVNVQGDAVEMIR